MIIAGTSPALYIDLGTDGPGMVLQRYERGSDWVEFLKDGMPVWSPVKIDDLPAGKYRQITKTESQA